MPDNGFWTPWGPASTVDWCEPNYVVTVWVAEWWNSLSSLPIALLGVVAVVWSLRPPWRSMPRFAVAGLVLAVVGFGSAAFHATLLRVGQALDELPMVYAGLTYLYVVLARRSGAVVTEDEARRLFRIRAALVGFAVAFTGAYLFFERWFLFFVAAYAFLVATLVVRTAWLSYSAEGSWRHQRLFWVAAGSYVGGVGVLWIPEHVVLGCAHPAQALHLHAWFHLTSAVGSYAWLLWAAHDRTQLERAAASKGF